MGQKVNQSIFRVGQNNNEWDYKYIEKNVEESSLQLYKNVETINFIHNFFKQYNILLHSCKIEYTQMSVNVIIYFFNLNSQTKNKTSFLITNILALSLNLYTNNKKINIKSKNLNKTLENKIIKKMINKNFFKKFKKVLKNKTYKNLIKVLLISVYEKNSAKLLADTISIYINKDKKKHYFIMSILKNYFNIIISSKFSKIKGLKIKISGRLNGAPRAKSKTIQIGAIPLQSFTSLISYHNSVAYTPNGSLGVKVWICQK